MKNLGRCGASPAGISFSGEEEMVAADNLLNRVKKVLSSRGFRVKDKHIMEKDLFSEDIREFDLIHAVSGDEKIVLTIRLNKRGNHRVHVSTRTSRSDEKLAERLEEIGMRVQEDDEGLTAAVTTSSSELVDKINKITRIVT